MSLSIVSGLVKFSMKRWSDPRHTRPVVDELQTDNPLVRQFVSLRNVVLSTRTSSSFRRGVVSVACSVATVLLSCDMWEMSRRMTSQHSTSHRGSATSSCSHARFSERRALSSSAYVDASSPSTSLVVSARARFAFGAPAVVRSCSQTDSGNCALTSYRPSLWKWMSATDGPRLIRRTASHPQSNSGERSAPLIAGDGRCRRRS